MPNSAAFLDFGFQIARGIEITADHVLAGDHDFFVNDSEFDLGNGWADR